MKRSLIMCLPLCAMLAGAPAWADAPAAAGPGVTAALAVLPPAALARSALESLPQLRQGVLHEELARASKDGLEAGRYEWLLRAGASRRTDQVGGSWREQELVLERPLRWFGKAAQDKAVGERGMAVADAAHEDAWHEAARQMLTDWFEALRAVSACGRLEQQQELALRLQRIAAQRVKAGDAAALELLQSETESGRVTALLLQARQQRDQALQQLRLTYPALPVPQDGALPAPVLAESGSDSWVERIVGHNHEVVLAQAGVELAQAQARRAASEKTPDPTLSLRSSRERDGQEKVLGLTLSMALPGGARGADSRAAGLRVELAREQLALTRSRVQLAAERAALDSARSLQVWQTLQQVSGQSVRQAEKMMRAYAGGEVRLGEALQTTRLALEANQAGQTAQLDALQALARLQLDAHLLWAYD